MKKKQFLWLMIAIGIVNARMERRNLDVQS